MSDKPYRIYTEVNGPVVTLADGERIISVAVLAGDADTKVDFVAANLNSTQQVTVDANTPWVLDFNGALRGPGSVTFTNPHRYVVTTETL